MDELLKTESSISNDTSFHDSKKQKSIKNDKSDDEDENDKRKLVRVKKNAGSLIESANFQFKESDDGIASKFRPYKKIIENLTNSITIKTEYEVVSCEWSNDGDRFLVIVK